MAGVDLIGLAIALGIGLLIGLQRERAKGAAARPDGEAGSGEAVYRAGAIVATYMHMYWPSNPEAVVALFGGEAFET